MILLDAGVVVDIARLANTDVAVARAASKLRLQSRPYSVNCLDL